MIGLDLILFAIAALGVVALALILFTRDRVPAPAKQEAVSLPIEEVITPVASPTTKTQHKEPDLSSLGFGMLDNLLVEPQEPSINLDEPELSEITPATAPVQESEILPVSKDIIVFYLLAPPDHYFTGYELLQDLLTADLRFGEKSIFHRYESVDVVGTPLFSVASAIEPGVFDLANIGGFSCPGLSIFMSAKQVENPLATFDLMLETAQQLAEDLGGQLYDEHRRPLGETVIKQYRAGIQHDN